MDLCVKYGVLFRSAAAITATLLACGCYDTHSEAEGGTPLASRTISVAETVTLCAATPLDIAADAVIVGCVSANDEAGNFSRSFFIEDETGGAEVMAGIYFLHNKYPVGSRVSVNLNGCRVALFNNTLRIGQEPESYSSSTVDYFLSEVLLDRHIIRGDERTELQPTIITAATTDMCGRLVEVQNLKYEPSDESEERVFAGYRRFVAEEEGTEIFSYVDASADFASAQIPHSSITLRGILFYGRISGIGNRFYIKPRTLYDYIPATNKDSD